MSEADKKLKELKNRLEATNALPWSNISAWVAAAKPLVKRAFGDFFDDFVKITDEPKWVMLPRFSTGGSQWTGEPPRNNFDEASAKERELNRNKAEQAKVNILEFLSGLLDLPPLDTVPVSQRVGPSITANGDVVFGSKAETSFSNSPVGAAATAPGAVATGELSMGTLKEDAAKIQAALVTDQDRLDDLHELLHDALSQLLRSTRKMEFEQGEMGQVIAQIKASADDIWVKNELEGVKVPVDTDVAKAILSSPVLAAALKGLLTAA